MPKTNLDLASIRRRRSALLTLSSLVLLFLGLILGFSMFAAPLAEDLNLMGNVGLTFSIMMTLFCAGAILGGYLDIRVALISCAVLFIATFPFSMRSSLTGYYYVQTCFAKTGFETWGDHMIPANNDTLQRIVSTASLSTYNGLLFAEKYIVEAAMVFSMECAEKCKGSKTDEHRFFSRDTRKE